MSSTKHLVSTCDKADENLKCDEVRRTFDLVQIDGFENCLDLTSQGPVLLGSDFKKVTVK